MKTHRDYLKQQLRDESFSKEFRREKRKLRIAYDIHSARLKQGLTQKALAEKAGVTQQMVSRIETASKANMAYSTITKIANTLGMDVGLVRR
jgi:ribosome-binding protein aMBF1 (putative translation factor)